MNNLITSRFSFVENNNTTCNLYWLGFYRGKETGESTKANSVLQSWKAHFLCSILETEQSSQRNDAHLGQKTANAWRFTGGSPPGKDKKPSVTVMLTKRCTCSSWMVHFKDVFRSVGDSLSFPFIPSRLRDYALILPTKWMCPSPRPRLTDLCLNFL